jgi:hypothetical protein
MRRQALLILYVGAVILSAAASASAAPIVWTGPTTTFTKANGADWTQAANQDRITDTTWITRKNTEGIFNIKTEAGSVYGGPPTGGLSPANTQWAFGHAADWGSLTFDTWWNWQAGGPLGSGNPPGTVGKDAVLHLISDDIYLDIKFLSWADGHTGSGGFSYERSTAAADVPEPATMGLLALGLGGIAMLRRRRA